MQLPSRACETTFLQIGLFLDKPFAQIGFGKPITYSHSDWKSDIHHSGFYISCRIVPFSIKRSYWPGRHRKQFFRGKGLSKNKPICKNFVARICASFTLWVMGSCNSIKRSYWPGRHRKQFFRGKGLSKNKPICKNVVARILC